jgi:hypothetical protein
MDHSGAKPQINVVVKIKENMSCQNTLCLEHIMIVVLHNYKFILNKHIKKHTLPNNTLEQVD